MSATTKDPGVDETRSFLRTTVRDILAAQALLGKGIGAEPMADAIWSALASSYTFVRGDGELPAHAKRLIARAIRRSRDIGDQRLSKDAIRWVRLIVVERLEQTYVVTPR